MSLAPCSVAARLDPTAVDTPLGHRIEEIERRLAQTTRALRRAEAEIALLNDRLAWAEADLAAAAPAGEEPTALRPPR
jgi:Tfp pilus assembly protein FimV